MPKLVISSFAAARPKVGAKYLENHEAQIAKNCDTRSGELRALKATSAVAGVTLATDTKVLHSFASGQYFWSFTESNVKVARGPVIGDTGERTFWTGEASDGGKPKMGYSPYSITGTPPIRYPTNYYRLGIPKPAAAPSLALGTGGGCDISVQRTRVYFYTYVSAVGEEGPPSASTTITSVCPGQQVLITGMSTAPTGPYNIANKRIYRSTTGTDGSDFQLVAQIAVATTSYTDTILDANLSTEDEIPTANWSPPPDTLSRITPIAGSMLAALDTAKPKNVLISEPGVPHGWPSLSVKVVNHEAVDIASIGSSTVVLTNGTPYITTGADPASFVLLPMDIAQSCSSARGVVNYGDQGIIYPSPNGLIQLTPGGHTILTESLLDKDDWAAYKPDSVSGFIYNEQYIGFYNTGSTTGGFILDLKSSNVGWTTTDVYATAGVVYGDTLYLAVNNSLVKWQGASTKLTYQWKSKLFELNAPTNFAWGRVIASTYANLTFKLYADGVLRFTKAVTSKNPFRLPAGSGFPNARTWEMELVGTDDVNLMMIAHTSEEVKI